MEKEMINVSVSTQNEYIFITQKYNMGDEDTICLHPDQVDLLIKWLQEAKDTLEEL